MKKRKEFDSIGKINVPADKYWGASTERSKKYFDIGKILVKPVLIKSIAIIKKSAAIVHKKDKQIERKIANAINKLKLRHAVITSVDRDDLPDGGANHFYKVITETRKKNPNTTIEVLTPDFLRKGDSYKIVINAKPDVFNHNIETVPGLYRKVRPGSRYFSSLELLKNAKLIDQNIFTKSGLMVGLGENKNEIIQVMDDLRSANVDFLTIGQYLQPSVKHHPLDRYYNPKEFEEIVADFMKEKWKGDSLFLKELKDAGVFTSTPILSGLWKEFGIEQDPNSEVIEAISNFIFGQKETPQQLVDFYNKQIDRLKMRLEVLQKSAGKLKSQIVYTQKGNYDLRYKQGATISQYEDVLTQIEDVEKLIGKKQPEALRASLQEAFASSAQSFVNRKIELARFNVLQDTLRANLNYIFFTIQELTLDPNVESDILTEEKVADNPETYEMSDQEWDNMLNDASENNASNEKAADKGRLYIYSPPIIVHRFNKTAGSHAYAIMRSKQLEEKFNKEALTDKEKNELNALRAQKRFFEYTEKMSSTGQYKYKDHRLVAIHRNNIPNDLEEEILFYEKGTDS